MNNEMRTTRVRIRIKNKQIVQDCDVYCGRKQTQGGWNLSESEWHNPFVVDKEHRRDVCIQMFIDYLLYQRPDLLYRLRQGELKGKVLGCWCEPDEWCHCDILIWFTYNNPVLNFNISD